MSKVNTIEEALAVASKWQGKCHEMENEKIWAQSMAFQYLCKDMPNPTEMSLKARIVEQQQELHRLNSLVQKLTHENKELVHKIGTFKNLEQLVNKLKGVQNESNS